MWIFLFLVVGLFALTLYATGFLIVSGIKVLEPCYRNGSVAGQWLKYLSLAVLLIFTVSLFLPLWNEINRETAVSGFLAASALSIVSSVVSYKHSKTKKINRLLTALTLVLGCTYLTITVISLIFS